MCESNGFLKILDVRCSCLQMYHFNKCCLLKLQIRKQQSHMKDVLDGKKVKYEEIDISSSSEDRDKMRELCGDPKALPPQIFRGNKYLGVSMIRSLKNFFF